MPTNILAILHLTASWYGAECDGLPMANGDTFNMYRSTCAMWCVPFGTELSVTYEHRNVIVQVTDRGPAKRLLPTRQLDLSSAAFGFIAPPELGLIPVTVTIHTQPNAEQIVKSLHQFAELSGIDIITKSTPLSRRNKDGERVRGKASITLFVPQTEAKH